MPATAISVVVPARNESDRLSWTIRSILEGRSLRAPIEIVIIDDASDDGCCSSFAWEASTLEKDDVSIRIERNDVPIGTYRTRNRGVEIARGELVFITDAHVRMVRGWDQLVVRHAERERVIAAAVGSLEDNFRGYGCTVIMPYMGTNWIKQRPTDITPVPVAACIGTVLYRDVFLGLGGYDEGMLIYGGGEPEFSVRAWLQGCDVVVVPNLLVWHRFRPRAVYRPYVEHIRAEIVHNRLRFGFLYLSETTAMQVLRFHALRFPQATTRAVELLRQSDIWDRRARLEVRRVRDFAWFLRRFRIRGEEGRTPT